MSLVCGSPPKIVSKIVLITPDKVSKPELFVHLSPVNKIPEDDKDNSPCLYFSYGDLDDQENKTPESTR